MASDSADSKDDLSVGDVSITQDFCCVYLQARAITVCFRLCPYAKVCFRCYQILIEENQTCPVCRSDISPVCRIDIIYL